MPARKPEPGQSLADLNPNVAAEWHPTLNGELTAKDVSPINSFKAWWIGANCGHTWEAPIYYRTIKKLDCPYCSGRRLLTGFNDLQTKNPNLAKEWHPTLNGSLTAKDVFASSATKVWWLGIECGHAWDAILNDRSSGQGCPICAGKRVLFGFNDLRTKNSFLASQFHPTKNGLLTPETCLSKSSKKIWWLCSNNHEWEGSPSDRAHNLSCPFCSNKRVWPGFNDLDTTHPLISREIHPTKNNGITGKDMTRGSGKKLIWLGYTCNHEWETTVLNRVNKNSNCPICAGQKPERGVNDLATINPLLSREIHPAKNNGITGKDVTSGSNKKLVWVGNACGHEWKATVNARQHYGCPFCSGKRVIVGKTDLDTTHPLLSQEIHPTKNNGITGKDVKAGSNKKLIWIGANCSHEWKASIVERTNHMTNCPICSGRNILVGFNDLNTIYPLLGREIDPSKNNGITGKDVTISSGKKLVWTGYRCHHEWKATIANRVKGSNCPVCSGRQVLVGYNDLETTHPLLSQEIHPTKNNGITGKDVIKGSNKKLIWVGTSCGHEWETLVYNRTKGQGCPSCHSNVSKTEKSIAEYFQMLDLNVITSNRTLIAPLEIDIYFPDKKIGIEYNGIYWHSDARNKNSNKDYVNVHKNKWLKAKDAGISLIQIWEDDWKLNSKSLLKQLTRHLMDDDVYKPVTIASKQLSNNSYKIELVNSIGQPVNTCLYTTSVKTKEIIIKNDWFPTKEDLKLLIEHLENNYPEYKILSTMQNDFDTENYKLHNFKIVEEIAPTSFHVIKHKRVLNNSNLGTNYPSIWNAGTTIWSKQL